MMGEMVKWCRGVMTLGTAAALVAGATSVPAEATANAATHLKRCEQGLYVGGTASCPFARKVADAFTPGKSTFRVYSPVTRRYYKVRCSNSDFQATCRTGRATVVIHGWWES